MRKLQRIQVGHRIFGFKYGATWLAFKEYRRNVCASCGDSVAHHGTLDKQKCLAPGCDCRAFKRPKLLSFAVGRPKVINHRTVREIIAERIGMKEKPCKTKKSKKRSE